MDTDRIDCGRGGNGCLAEGRFRGKTLWKRRVGPFVVSETSYSPGEVIGRHSHANAYICLVRRGSFTEETPDASREPGSDPDSPESTVVRELVTLSTSYHPPKEEHTERIHEDGVLSFNIEIPPSWVSSNCHRKAGGITGGVSAPGAKSTWLASRLCDAFHDGSRIEESVVSASVSEWIDSSEVTPRSVPRRGWIDRVRAVVDADPSSAASLEELAKLAGVHRVYVGEAFRREFGVPIGDYRRQRQVSLASRALAETDWPLAQVGLHAGFFDQPHFSRTFKKYAGMTPGRFRALYRVSGS